MTRPKTGNALQAVLDRQVRAEPPGAASAPPSPVPATHARRGAAVRNEERTSSFRPSREGKRFIGGYFEPKVARQIKLLAAEDETTVQELVAEALDLLFIKKGKGRIVRGNTEG